MLCDWKNDDTTICRNDNIISTSDVVLKTGRGLYTFFVDFRFSLGSGGLGLDLLRQPS